VNIHPLRDAIGAHLGQVLTPEVATAIELQALAAASQPPEDHRAVEVHGGDADSGGVLAVVTRIRGGYELESHQHAHGHLSVLAKGTADVTVDGVVTRYTGPCHVSIPPGTKHAVSAVTDVVWYCLWADDNAPRQQIEDALSVAKASMQEDAQ
jgi:quercetin dioxygenase-like cupin family protein